MVELAEGESVIYGSELNYSRAPDLRFIHYNDVYHVEASSAEPVGGIARFQTLCNYYRNDPKFKDQPRLMILFSGDAFNPSLESSVTKGSHMVPVLNGIGTDIACIGNHDLDFGVAQFKKLATQCKFPWLIANVLDPALGKNIPIGNCLRTKTLQSDKMKVGFVGVGEREWLGTINSLPPNLQYLSASGTSNELAPQLRKEGAEIVIALSHQREPNDIKLAEKSNPGTIDIVLGGHDHMYNIVNVNGIPVLRSGTDFKNLSYVEAWRRESGGFDFRITRRDVVSSIPEDTETLKVVERLTAKLNHRLERAVGATLVPLDARFSTVRLKESTMGNFVCDILRHYYDGDVCLMGGGTFRGDQIYPPGIIKLKDIMNCFPFEDPMVLLSITGAALLHAMENSVSLYPALEGRFPQVSGMKLEFDPSKPAGQRVVSLTVNDEPLDKEKKYKMVTRGYMARGKDGYTSLLAASEGGEAEEIVNEEEGHLISTILRQFFMALRVLGRWRTWSGDMDRHWGGVLSGMQQGTSTTFVKARVTSFPRIQQLSSNTSYDSDSDAEMDETTVEDAKLDEQKSLLARRVLKKWKRLTGIQRVCDTVDDMGVQEFKMTWTKAVAPKIEGRVKIVGH